MPIAQYNNVDYLIKAKTIPINMATANDWIQSNLFCGENKIG